jgi:hypothetical protein
MEGNSTNEAMVLDMRSGTSFIDALAVRAMIRFPRKICLSISTTPREPSVELRRQKVGKFKRF